MAITFRSQISSNNFLPSSNPINVTVESDNNSKCDFKYVCDIYVDEVKRFRIKLFPNPGSGLGFFQLSEVISDYLREVMPSNYGPGAHIATFNDYSTSLSKVYLKFGEEYNSEPNCEGDIEIYPNLATSNTFYVYYGAVDYLDWPSYDSSDYVTDYATGEIKFLTNRTRDSVKLSFNDNYFLDYLTSAAADSSIDVVYEIKGEVYLGGSLKNIDPIVKIPLTTIAAFRRMRISCGPNNLNGYTGLTWINDSTEYYYVYLEKDGTRLSEKFKITVRKPNERMTRFFFIGNLGSPEAITFYHRDIASYNINRKNYKNYLTSRYNYDWTYRVGDRQNETWAVNATKTSNISTFVSRDESEWLSELWLSTNIWKEIPPSIKPFTVVREDNTSTSRMLIRVKDASKYFTAGDDIYLFPDYYNNPIYYNGEFTISSIEGDYIDLGFTYNFYNQTACGWISNVDGTYNIPIVAEDNSVEIKEKTGGLIQYSFNYSDSVDKITLRS